MGRQALVTEGRVCKELGVVFKEQTFQGHWSIPCQGTCWESCCEEYGLRNGFVCISLALSKTYQAGECSSRASFSAFRHI